MNYVIWLSNIGEEQLAQVGGKAFNIAALIKAGFKIPDGFCITSDALRRFLTENNLHEKITKQLDGISAENFDDIIRRSRVLRRLLRRGRIPRAVEREIKAAYTKLCHDKKAGRTPVAVRSSSAYEDMPEASFAGIHETKLNVKSFKALIESVKSVWFSLWSPQAILYREKSGFDHVKASMAVIVQVMVSPNVSGVMFSANPVSGDEKEVVINSCWGLGLGVVSGATTPDSFVVDKESLEIKQYHIAKKSKMIIASPTGGIQRAQTPREKRDSWSLSREQIRKLTETCIKVEQLFGMPQDIEWAISSDGEIYILQSRPISTLLSKYDWRDHRSVFQKSIESAIEDELAEYMDEIRRKDRTTTSQEAARLAEEWQQKVVPKILEDVRRIEDVKLERLSNDMLADLLEDSVKINQQHFTLRVKIGALIELSLSRLESVVKQFYPELDYTALLSGFGTRDWEAGVMLWQLSQEARNIPRVVDALRIGDTSEAIKRIGQDEEGRRWLRLYERFLEEFGHLSPARWDVMAKTYAEDAGIIFSIVRGYVEEGGVSPLESREKLVKERERLVQETLNRVPAELLGELREALAIAQRNYPIKEDRNFYYLRSLAAVRRVVLHAGSRLYDAGHLDSPEDVFFLAYERVVAALRGDTEGIRLEARRNRLRYLERSQTGSSLAMLHEKCRRLEYRDGRRVLRGFPCGGGVVEGRARVLRSLHRLEKVRRGDIIVCPAVSPGWSPILNTVGGLVSDLGGPLSHAAILAREYKLPAVVGTALATKLIPDGCHIVLDADKGLVWF